MKFCENHPPVSYQCATHVSWIQILLPASDEYVVEGGGFEPPKSTTTDLQSVPFGRSGIPPGRTCFLLLVWSWRWDSNPQPADYKSAALPVELRQHSCQPTFIGTCLFKE